MASLFSGESLMVKRKFSIALYAKTTWVISCLKAFMLEDRVA
jgi:hypothetical protein